MRHRKDHRKLGRTASHRRVLLSGLAASLFDKKRIRTTLAKAREARRLAERLITSAKRGDLASRRRVLMRIKDKKIVKTLFEEIAPSYAERNGGYTRIIKLGQRVGDGAPVAILELVGYETIHTEKKTGEKKKKEK